MAKDLMVYFRAEAKELVEKISEALLDFEKSADSEVLTHLLRYAHTLKGAARVVGQKELAASLHAFEELLAPYRTSELKLSSAAMSGLLETLNQISDLVKQLDGASPSEKRGSPRISGNDITPLNLENEADSLRSSLRSVFEELHTLRRDLVELERHKDLSELLLSQLRTNQSQREAQAIAETLKSQLQVLNQKLTTNVERLSRELHQAQDEAESLRLVRAESLFPILRRAARQASLQMNRKVEMTTVGGKVGLETGLLHAVQGALLQAVYNSVAHGIELPQERLRKGKSSHGNLRIEIFRLGREVTFLCRDDGRGVDLSAARREFAAKGMDVEGWDEAKILEGLMGSGISTASEVTLASGRGIGLGLIRQVAATFGGKASLSTEPGSFTEVKLQLPWSSVVLEFLQVSTELHPGTGLHRILLPFETVQAAMLLKNTVSSHGPNGESLVFQGKTLRMVSLSSLLGQPSAQENAALILRTGHESVALTVSSIRGRRTGALLPIPDWTRPSPFVAGAVMDLDGTPKLVLDVEKLSDEAPRLPRKTIKPAWNRHRLLVIDDSLTTRTLQENILGSAGFSVHLASSGEEGLEALEKSTFSLILVDVEMPGIDGFTFIQRLREGPHGGLPVILVTSRNSPEDKLRAEQVGVQGYIVKSEFTPKILLHTVNDLLSSQVDPL